MERAHGELRARLADGLRGDDAGGFAQLDPGARGQVAAIATDAHAVLAFAGQHRADLDLLDVRAVDEPGLDLVDFLVGLDEQLLRLLRIRDVVAGKAAHEAVAELDHLVFAFVDGLDPDAVGRAAIVLADDHVLRHIHQLAGHVARVGGLERGVGQTLAGAVGRDEVLEHREALAEVGENRLLDDVAGGLGHEAAHAGELADLLPVAARAGIDHERDRVVLLLALVVVERLQHDVGDLVGAVRPDVNDLVVAFARGDDTLAILLLDFLDLLLGGVDFLILLLGNDHVVDADGHARARGLAEAQFLELVEHGHRLVVTANLVALPDEVAELALLDRLVGEAQFLRPDLAEEDAAHGGLDDLLVGIAELGLLAEIGIGQANALMGRHRAIVEGKDDLGLRAEQLQLPRVRRRRRPRLRRQIEAAQRDVLGRRDNGPAAGWAEDVVGRHHEQARFQLGFDGQRHVHGHLVAVEVGVVGGADQRMDADGFAFDELRLEGLHRQAVQGRGAVQQHRMAAGHFFENVPHLGGLAFDQLLGRPHGVDIAQFLEAADDEGLEQDERHLLGQTALVQLEFRTDDDDRAAGVIHALAQQVLAEAPALALEHVAERFQGAVAGPGDRAAMAAVVEQRINRFLQHALFVADDDFRRLELEQVLQPVVPVDDAAIEVVEVGGGKAAAFQRHQRAQVRRDDRQHGEDHPFRPALGGLQTLEQLDALGDLLADLLALGLGHGRLQVVDLLAEVHFRQAPRAPLRRPSWRGTPRGRRFPALRDTHARSRADSV